MTTIRWLWSRRLRRCSTWRVPAPRILIIPYDWMFAVWSNTTYMGFLGLLESDVTFCVMAKLTDVLTGRCARFAQGKCCGHRTVCWWGTNASNSSRGDQTAFHLEIKE